MPVTAGGLADDGPGRSAVGAGSGQSHQTLPGRIAAVSRARNDDKSGDDAGRPMFEPSGDRRGNRVVRHNRGAAYNSYRFRSRRLWCRRHFDGHILTIEVVNRVVELRQSQRQLTPSGQPNVPYGQAARPVACRIDQSSLLCAAQRHPGVDGRRWPPKKIRGNLVVLSDRDGGAGHLRYLPGLAWSVEFIGQVHRRWAAGSAVEAHDPDQRDQGPGSPIRKPPDCR